MSARIMSIISVVLLSFLSLVAVLTDQPFYHQLIPYAYCFNDKGNYTNPSTYQTNLDTLLSKLTSNTQIDYGFYNFSYGQDPDRVNAIGLCRGDVKPAECLYCLTSIKGILQNSCPNQKEVIGGFDLCMLRYSNRSILEKMEDDFSIYVWDPNNMTEVERVEVSKLLSRLKDEAASGDSLRKFAVGSETGSNSQAMYGAVQCVPNLSRQDCVDCLTGAISEIPRCCGTKRGGRVIKPSCNIRFEGVLFYSGVEESPQASPSNPTSKGKRDTRSRTVAKVIVPIIVSVVLFCLGCFLLIRIIKRKSYNAMLKENFGEDTTSLKSLRFDLATIEAATNKFSYENKIGKGGFGEVYKGVLLDGQEVAVKRLSKNSAQGALEFKNEVLLIAKHQHRNLVTLLGFCLEEQEKILIYEYVPNKSLDYFLFDSQKQKALNWHERFKIIGGIARGLHYLHEHSRLKVIHRDLKPSNILLDSDMNPKISDFGMAKMIALDEDQGNTNRVVGTHGYMSPEYIIHGQFSEKSDIFSFGVIILEIIGGKRNYGGSNESHLLSEAWKHWHDGTPLQILDSSLLESCSPIEVIKCVQIGLLCVQENPDDRPTITQIVSSLSNLSVELPSPRQPAFFMYGKEYRNKTIALEQSSQSSVPFSSYEMSKSVVLPR